MRMKETRSFLTAFLFYSLIVPLAVGSLVLGVIIMGAIFLWESFRSLQLFGSKAPGAGPNRASVAQRQMSIFSPHSK